MLGKLSQHKIIIVVECILGAVAVLSPFYEWKIEAILVAVMGFAFIIYWDDWKEKQFKARDRRRVGGTMLSEITFNLRVVAQNKAIRDEHDEAVPVKYNDASWHAFSAGGYLLVLPDDLIEKLGNLYRSILDSNRFIERIEELTIGVSQALSSAASNRQAIRNWVFDRLDDYENRMTEIKAALEDFLGGV
jgi:membrane protein implicated in regulation of membrane protease activity